MVTPDSATVTLTESVPGLPLMSSAVTTIGTLLPVLTLLLVAVTWYPSAMATVFRVSAAWPSTVTAMLDRSTPPISVMSATTVTVCATVAPLAGDVMVTVGPTSSCVLNVPLRMPPMNSFVIILADPSVISFAISPTAVWLPSFLRLSATTEQAILRFVHPLIRRPKLRGQVLPFRHCYR